MGEEIELVVVEEPGVEVEELAADFSQVLPSAVA